MSRADRLNVLVAELRAAVPGSRTVPSLARRLRVSERTIQRDLRALAEAGLPVRNAVGRGGGWYLEEELTLPPVAFTPAEALAVMGALGAQKPVADGPARGALRKLSDAVPVTGGIVARDAVRRVLELPHLVDPRVRRVVEDAVLRRQVVRLAYLDARERRTCRDVEVAGLVQVQGQWLLVGWCRLRRAARGFRLERILAAEATGETAPPRPLGDLLALTRPAPG
jgi:predicted DNA-binding transcriptional regulator YafY